VRAQRLAMLANLQRLRDHCLLGETISAWHNLSTLKRIPACGQGGLEGAVIARINALVRISNPS
jgi:hypothetical protein